jgi:hypothetical protein
VGAVAVAAVIVAVLGWYLLAGGQGPGSSAANAILLSGTASGHYVRGSYQAHGIYYKFSVGSEKRAIVTLTTSVEDLEIVLFSSDILNYEPPYSEVWFDVWIGTTQLYPDEWNVVHSIATGSAGTYYVCVCGAGSGDYSLSLSEVSPPSPATIGGSFSDAIIMTDSPTTGYVGQDQSVYYKISVSAGQKVHVGLRPVSDNSANQHLILYDSSQQQIWTNISLLGLRSSTTAKQSGYYYAEIWGREAGSYTLSFYTS